ncbi:type VI secretion system tube protein TssD [Pedobacter sp.]|uniref:type VI secretion system tube protein TssD n=1 Tax=Pedobacter sp. TaxID=1411316 RepID=UPI003BAABA4E
MALNAYLTLKGKKTGEFKGSVLQKGRENKILVIAASHELAVPTDAATGLASGRLRHIPFKITKELDRASPLLYNALATNEALTDCKVEFWGAPIKSSAGGANEVQKYTVRLTNARITGIRFVMPNIKDPELVKYVEYEEISFAYQTIEWIWTDGNLSASDDW